MQFFSFNNPHLYITIFISIMNAIVLLFVAYKHFQTLQLGGYKAKEYWKWLYNWRESLRPCFIGFGGFLFSWLVIYLCRLYFIDLLYAYSGMFVYFALFIMYILDVFMEKQKTPLKITKRIKRLDIFFCLLVFILSFFLSVFCFYSYTSFSSICLCSVALPILVFCSYYCLLPIENAIKKKYIKKAKKKLEKMPNLVRIGITGSFGKTSTKYILNTLLKEKFSVCMSPNSYNTETGLSLVVNNILKNEQILIAEMGARRCGDIKQICDFIKPQYAIITGVGNQHLETFKSIENIEKTKYELVESLPNNGVAVFNGDNLGSKKMFEKTQSTKYLVSIIDDDFGAKNIKIIPDGTRFDLMIKGKKYPCLCKLLGEHNIQNLLLCIKMSLLLGLSIKQIQKGINDIKPVPHRLELINNNGLLVLDDSYNCSVEGYKTALKKLSVLGNKKIVVTPGIVELGAEQWQENVKFGNELSKVVDYVLIVNKTNMPAILKGLKMGDFDEEKIICIDTLKEVQDNIKNLLKIGEIVLFENDLPDNYV